MGPRFTLDQDPSAVGDEPNVPDWLDVERIEEMLSPPETDWYGRRCPMYTSADDRLPNGKVGSRPQG